jgi:hypothetical protein
MARRPVAGEIYSKYLSMKRRQFREFGRYCNDVREVELSPPVIL